MDVQRIIRENMYGTPRKGIMTFPKKLKKTFPPDNVSSGPVTTSTVKKFVKGVGGVGRKLKDSEW